MHSYQGQWGQAEDSPVALSGSRELGHSPTTGEQKFDLRALPVPGRSTGHLQSAACVLHARIGLCVLTTSSKDNPGKEALPLCHCAAG